MRPLPPVAIARCSSYEDDISGTLAKMFDQLGLNKTVANKTITIKLNLTGSPGLRFQGKPLGVTHYSHPKTLAAMIAQLDRAGARRIRMVESCWATRRSSRRVHARFGLECAISAVGCNSGQGRV